MRGTFLFKFFKCQRTHKIGHAAMSGGLIYKFSTRNKRWKYINMEKDSLENTLNSFIFLQFFI